MRATQLYVQNFRALRDIAIPLSRFGCLIGKNNSGKSSCLQALVLFFSGARLNPEVDYFNSSEPVRITLTFEDITDADLARLVEQHRSRIKEIVQDGCLELVRVYGSDGRSSLKYRSLVPVDQRFADDQLIELFKGQRAGSSFVEAISTVFPELATAIDTSMNQTAMREQIDVLASSLPSEEMQMADKDLVTGLDRSIDAMLPTPIYVAAVKDLRDDIKTTESTPLGRILSILLSAVESQLPQAQEWFDQLNSRLNLVVRPDGSINDERLEDVKQIESTVERFVRESFADVRLRIEIPPPELKTIFSSTRIHANDGVEGLVDTKGDGLRRAVVFSILRAYVELSKTAPDPQPDDQVSDVQPIQASPPKYFLLFEEPELYLHPEAQRILFEALRVFAVDHQVLVTTHSPVLFGPNATETFVKLSKASKTEIAEKPFTSACSVDLRDIDARDQFQIICYESNNAAFFAEAVVLVEGPSDDLVLSHIAKTLNSTWDATQKSVHFVRIAGKGNIRKYREFFKRFEVSLTVIADLDLVLDGFHHVAPTEELTLARSQLLTKVDEFLDAEEEIESSTRAARDNHGSGELRSMWREAKRLHVRFQAGDSSFEQVSDKVEAFFAWERNGERLKILRECEDAELRQQKWQLLETLRSEGIYVLEKGAIEDYYPETIEPADKPTRALQFCEQVTDAATILSCCNEQKFLRNGEAHKDHEFNLIFAGIFGV